MLWLLTAIGSASLALHEINELADSQMAQLARTLLQTTRDYHQSSAGANIMPSPPFPGSGYAEDNNTGFAIWNPSGKRILADRHGMEIPYQTTPGFTNNHPIWRGNSWRYLYLHDAETGHTVAVTQRQKERLAILASALSLQLGLTLLSLPLLALLLSRGIRRGLLPLTRLSTDLHNRDANNLYPLPEQVPAETLPFIQSLNRLFARLADALVRERRFTADAAHELRSPLAALKVQTDVLAITEDADEQQHHLHHITRSIERTQRLVDQLLVLARLDPLQQLPETMPLNWLALTEQALTHANRQAREKRIRLILETPGAAENLPTNGNPTLLELMLRNLLDNAIRYSPENSSLTVQVATDRIAVCDQGPGIAAEHLPHIRERFYRPAGQNEQGSGLGLSIVERIATLHGLQLDLLNHTPHGLCAVLTPIHRHTSASP